ncbi:thiol reductant ABC exporter subunit CydC [Jidongwangia harbinensis]|uniref:thiol reductant ABC exporter subunit CydC n=1 Tax=Jidongwangia harbinensis TaxID=2878561 RepID=UPI001CDA44BD|nr:thiol reductant ABC exporter subunit CydC [Jidongwangia harbinensis]MCA2212000.1 thiol reductant ABC exporter subunit CydC [Jidongwangia harbinensis]
MTASRAPVDPRLLRHARTARTGVAALAVIGAGQAGATLLLLVALTRAVTGPAGDAVPLLAAGYLLRAVLTWAEQVAAHHTAARVTDELRRTALTAVLRRGPAWVARYGSGRLTATLTTGLDALRPWFGGYLPALVLGVALPPLVLLAMAAVDPASAVVALLTLPLVPVLGALIGWATQARARQRWAADARLAGHFLDVVRGLATLRVYGRAERQIGVVAAMTDRHRAATMRVLRTAFLSSTALDLVGTLSVGLIAVEAGLRVAAGDLALAPALLVILLAPEAYRPLREMAARYHAATDATAVIGDIDEVWSGAEPGPAADPSAAVGVTATGLRVRHPGAVADALALDALTVSGGELVALRGVSGAGKTTALRALAGLQPLDAGRLRVSGPPPVYLPQRPTLPHARTVRDALAAPGGSPPPGPEAVAALRAVGLDGELDPDAALGEHGHGVSAGQRQRLALAAVLRRAQDAPVTLLLDEPTAHLDVAAERRVLAELRAAADRGCAVLVVAHRPALLAAADRVVTVTPPRAGGGSPARTDPAPDRPEKAAAGATAPLLRHPAVAVALGAAAWLAGIVLTGAATWLLVRAATLPPVLTLSTAVVLVRGSAVARPLLRYLERLVAHEVAFARLGALRSRVYAGLIPRVPGPHRHRRGDLLTRLVDDVDAEVDGLLRGRLPALAAVLAVLVAAGAAMLTAPAVTVPLLAGLAVSGVLAPAVAARLAARRETATGTARAEVRDAVVETVDGVEDLTGPDALAVPERRSRALARLEARAARAAGLAGALGHLGWGVAVTGTALALGGTPGLSAEWAAVLLLGVVALTDPVAALPDAALARQRAAAARIRLAAVAPSSAGNRNLGSAGIRDAGPAPERPVRAGGRGAGVTVRGLVAGWDPDRTPALDGLDLDLPAGSRTAIQGRSGSGKSTLAAVLARLLAARAGTVRIDGRDLATLPESAVRRLIGLVGDDTGHLFASTVRENLRLAAPAATDADLIAVLHRVGLADWLDRRPAGLDTWLGTGGATVSGGEARRLATARALLADPALLILDEPTEGLDAAGAEALMADLLDAAGGRTVLVLTHRTEGLDRVDARHDLAGLRPRPSPAAGRRTGQPMLPIRSGSIVMITRTWSRPPHHGYGPPV